MSVHRMPLKPPANLRIKFSPSGSVRSRSFSIQCSSVHKRVCFPSNNGNSTAWCFISGVIPKARPRRLWNA